MTIIANAIWLLLLSVVNCETLLPRGQSSPAVKKGKNWVVDSKLTFTNAQTFTFSGSTVPDGLSVANFKINNWSATTYARLYDPKNVVVSGGWLQLKVPGGQTQSPISGGEIIATANNILYASVRTTAILGNAAGTVNGMFFYKSDTQEIDIEWISDASSGAQPEDGSRAIFYTNQDVNGDTDNASTYTDDPPSRPTKTAHEYRVDWMPGKVKFYIDGVRQLTITDNVPTQAGTWRWNNWSNGNPNWSAGPPKSDNIFKISSIVMYYNTTSS